MTGFAPAVRQQIVARAAGGWCERCGHYAMYGQIHHRRPRGMGGSTAVDTNTAANGLWLCGKCHAHVESHRAYALLNGYLVRQGHDPAGVPVRVHGDWVLLNDEGGLTPARGPA